MAFFNSAVDVLQTLVVALGAGLGIWGGKFRIGTQSEYAVFDLIPKQE